MEVILLGALPLPSRVVLGFPNRPVIVDFYMKSDNLAHPDSVIKATCPELLQPSWFHCTIRLHLKQNINVKWLPECSHSHAVLRLSFLDGPV